MYTGLKALVLCVRENRHPEGLSVGAGVSALHSPISSYQMTATIELGQNEVFSLSHKKRILERSLLVKLIFKLLQIVHSQCR